MLNTGAVSANLFAKGAEIANGEMIQFHPTIAPLHVKNMLISKTVRGEDGRLFAKNDERSFYFMEEKYPELGNLMPRDVISKEEFSLINQGCKIYLDMTEIPLETVKNSQAVEDNLYVVLFL